MFGSRSGFTPIIIAIVIALAAILIGGGYVVYKNRGQQQPTGDNSQQTTQNQNTPANIQPQTYDISAWKTYRNDKYGFEVKYPIDWIITSDGLEYDDNPTQGSYGFWLTNNNSSDFMVHLFPTCQPTAIFVTPRNDIPENFEQTLCKGKFTITLGVWRTDKVNLSNAEEMLEKIASTFKFTPSTSLTTGSTVDASTVNTSTLNDLPALYPKFIWALPSETIKQNGIYYNNFQFESDRSKYFQKSISIVGQEWAATTTVPCGRDMYSYVQDVQQYYDNELQERRGWNNSWEITSNNLSFYSLEADGPFGSTWGFVKTDGNNIRAVILNYFNVSYYNNPNPSCPGILKFTVFVSDTIPLHTLTQ